jgi:hypothetical protein
LLEIYLFLTQLAVVLPVKFIRKDLDLDTAIVAFTKERFKMPQCFKTGQRVGVIDLQGSFWERWQVF